MVCCKQCDESDFHTDSLCVLKYSQCMDIRRWQKETENKENGRKYCVTSYYTGKAAVRNNAFRYSTIKTELI